MSSLIAVSGPSGGGKTSLCETLEDLRDFKFSVSATTRKKRPGEIDGKHYLFLSKDEFESRIGAGEFAEHAFVHGKYYGTPMSTIDEVRMGGRVVCDINVDGYRRLRERFGQEFGANFKSIFVSASPDALRERLSRRGRKGLSRWLLGRGRMSPEEMERRLAEAAKELQERDKYNYWITNDDLERAKARLLQIIDDPGSCLDHLTLPESCAQ